MGRLNTYEYDDWVPDLTRDESEDIVYPACELCGTQSDGVTHYGHHFCSAECARCFDCEHRSGVACWYRVNMGTRAGHAWIKRVKRCPKVKANA